ncbi:hypothetical protein [Pseudonocardia sp. KRD291]|uniref:hypothetical protein n=1 Tax=Pseudonocardia sp. KRD291 TaxID=2792007 RepID=UPI001C4A2DD3|nr:hypothetical protein [Pseudonocardia sp. KRD291]MBW0105269.1 hypothetical protein [Pseudonocardia sp. KRD291]
MDIQNHYYGHSSVLAAYTGLSRPRHIAGLLQHGWTLVSPLGVHFGDFPRVGARRGRNLLVWSHHARGWDPASADRPSVEIGSPFSYLEMMLGERGWAPSGDGGPVYFPFHGSSVVRITGDQAALAEQVAAADGPSTVCLHADDCEDSSIVNAWARAGHRLVTAGHRHDPDFLLRIMSLLGSASRVSSNRLSSALIYAASMDVQISVYGDPLVAGVKEQNPLDMAQRTWPEFHLREPDPEVLRPIARRELGADAILTAAGLRRALGWADRHRAGPAADYWVGSSLVKAGKVLGLSQRAANSATSVPVVRPWVFVRQPLSHLPRGLPRGLKTPVQLVAPVPIASHPSSVRSGRWSGHSGPAREGRAAAEQE